jgi:YfiR/HmsC-like
VSLPGHCRLKTLIDHEAKRPHKVVHPPHRTHRVFLLTCLLLIGSRLASPQSQQDEYQLKAAFIFHFAQLVEWPGEGSNLVFCTLGDDPFHGKLDDTVSGKQIGSRMLQVRHVRQLSEVHRCQLLFISKAEVRRIPAVLSELQHSPVLTVGETDGFLDAGGIIRFCLERNKLRFEINRSAAETAGLKVSSRLLVLAKNGVGDRGGK